MESSCYKTDLGWLYKGNCVEILKTFDTNGFDLTITSPPYDDIRDYEGYSFDFEGVANELYRVTKDGGIVVWIVGDSVKKGSETLTSFKQALYFKKIGFNIHDTMIYAKNSFIFPEQNRYIQVFEYTFILSKGKPKTSNLLKVPTNPKNRKRKMTSNYRAKDGSTEKGKYECGKSERSRSNIWTYEVGFNKSTKDNFAFEHPAMFPEKLAEDHIISWSNEGDTVLDPFMGSGTVAKMCERLKRKWIGIEISEKYCNLIEKRVDEERKQLRLF